MTKYCSARTFIVAFYTFLGLHSSLHAAEYPADAALDRLQNGEVVVTDSDIEESGGSVRAEVLVDAPARAVWDVVSSCAHAMRYLNGMKECEVLVDEADSALTHHVVDQGWLTPKLDYRFATRRDPYRNMDFELRSGNLKRLQGHWRFEPVDGGTLVEHEIDLAPKVPAPRWLVNRLLRRDLPGMLSCIRGLAERESSGQAAESDLAACQESEGTSNH